MHVIQTLTAIHDRYLSVSKGRATELYHWSQAVSIFNRKLSSPVLPSDRDPIWATASLLGAITYSSIDASTPEEAWPLRDSDSSDLEWLRIGNGKAAIWKLTNPLRLDSLFHKSATLYMASNTPSIASAPINESVPPRFIQLYNLDSSSTADNNPYHAAVSTLAPLLHLQGARINIIKFFSFTGHIRPEFQRLLEQKDPRALLLLAYWYAKVCRTVWWMERRAKLECQAICIYLERYHADEMDLKELLLFPKAQCGSAADY